MCAAHYALRMPAALDCAKYGCFATRGVPQTGRAQEPVLVEHYEPILPAPKAPYAKHISHPA